MREITVFDHAGNAVFLEPVGRGLYEKVIHEEAQEVKRTGNIVNLDTALQCGSLFTEEQRSAYLKRKEKRK